MQQQSAHCFTITCGRGFPPTSYLEALEKSRAFFCSSIGTILAQRIVSKIIRIDLYST
jgi:hypothetical protein